MELKTYLTILARRWQIILLVVFVVLGMSIYATKYVRYQAEASLQVITPLGGTLGSTYHETAYANRLMNTYVEIATSDKLRNELKEDLKLERLPDINVKTVPNSEIIQIDVESPDPTLAARTANRLAELIIAGQDEALASSTNSDELNILINRNTELEKSLAQAQDEYGQLVQNYSESTARMAVLDKTIEIKNSSYQSTLEQYQQAVKDGATTQARLLRDELDRMEKEFASIDQQYEVLSTDVNKYSQQLIMARQIIQNDQDARTSILSRYDSVLGAQYMEERTQNILIISPAVEPTRPMLGPVFIVILGLMCGLVAGIVIAFVVDNLDTRIFTAEQVGAITTVPVLGGFPQLHRKERRSGDISPARYGGYLLSRKKIFQSLQSKLAKTILITSPNPREGKSIVAAGLAVSLAEEHHKVLIIDANLRRPQQQILHSVSDQEDLSAFLRNEEVEIEDVIQRNVKPGIDLLPCLAKSSDPSELLRSSQLKVLFEKVKTYDFILIDTPALLSAPDAHELTAFVDGVLIVVQQRHTTVGDIQSACQYLEGSAAKLLGIVINRLPMKAHLGYSRPEAEWIHHIKISAREFVSKHA